MVHLVTEVEFKDGNEASDKTVQNYRKSLGTPPTGSCSWQSGRSDRECLSHRNQDEL
jgi:hypothetical protein